MGSNFLNALARRFSPKKKKIPLSRNWLSAPADDAELVPGSQHG